MQRILHDDGSTVIPLYASYVQAASDKLELPENIGNNLGTRWQQVRRKMVLHLGTRVFSAHVKESGGAQALVGVARTFQHRAGSS